MEFSYNKQKIIVTSNPTVQKKSLVDYLAQGYIERDGEKIPCRIGFNKFSDKLEPAYIFIDNGITESGNHYDAETINIDGLTEDLSDDIDI